MARYPILSPKVRNNARLYSFPPFLFNSIPAVLVRTLKQKKRKESMLKNIKSIFIITCVEKSLGYTKKQTLPITTNKVLARLQNTRSIYKTQLYFDIIIIINYKN